MNPQTNIVKPCTRIGLFYKIIIFAGPNGMHMVLVKNKWRVDCDHTPEMIDRILMPIRKRGLSVQGFNYKAKDNGKALCDVEFEVDENDGERIFKNMHRITGIHKIKKL